MATSYDFSPDTVGQIQALKKVFGVATNTAVIKHAVGLATLIAENVDMSEGKLVIGGANGMLIRVVFA